MDRLIRYLQSRIPADDETRMVHGDYRIDNMIFHKAEPRVIAVLDWELSTLGHPLVGFRRPCHDVSYAPQHCRRLGRGGSCRTRHAIRGRIYREAYCQRTGRAGIPDYDFYLAFNFFRLAAIFHGIKGRAIRGTAASAQAAERGEYFVELAAAGRACGRALMSATPRLKKSSTSKG